MSLTASSYRDRALAVPSIPPPNLANASLWTPLRDKAFRAVWFANAVSNLGSWMQTMAAAWLMASLTESTSMVAFVQVAATLPVFLLVLPAGVLADRRRRWTIVCLTQAGMAVIALAMSVVASIHEMTPTLLLLGTTAMGCGTAVSMPAWQAAIATLVKPDEIHRAAVLNGMSFNVSRALGPALAGVMVQAVGIPAVFWLNFASFVGLIHTSNARRANDPEVQDSPRIGFVATMADGLRKVIHVPEFRSLLVRTFTCFFGASSLWSLLPAYGAFVLHSDASRLGSLMGTIGAGAVCGGFILSRMRSIMGANFVVCLASLLLAAAVAAMATSRSPSVAYPALAVAGVAWAFMVSTLNGCSQAMFPSDVRARAISAYLLAMYGGTAMGSLGWGTLATWSSIGTTFSIASVLLTLSALTAARWPVR